MILKVTFIMKTRLKKEGPSKVNTTVPVGHPSAHNGTAAAPGGIWILPQPLLA